MINALIATECRIKNDFGGATFPIVPDHEIVGKVTRVREHVKNFKTGELASVCHEKYMLHVPEALDLASAAPLLCAGITVYSTLKHWNAAPAKMVGILGIGGLGRLAIKIAKAMGVYMVVFTTSPSIEMLKVKLSVLDRVGDSPY